MSINLWAILTDQTLEQQEPFEYQKDYRNRVTIEVSRQEQKPMANSTQKNRNPKSKINPRQLSPEVYARLKAETKAPYRGLRKFIYFTFGASGFIGAVVFLAQLAGGQEVNTAIPNLALQIGVVALMVWLFRLEQRAERKP